MRVVICAPIAPGDARREEIWKWVRAEWLERHHPDFPIYEGVAVGAGNARNIAARDAGDWDIALFNDADTVADPAAVYAAIERAAESMQLVIAADSHMYCSEGSSNRIMAGGLFLPRPYAIDAPDVYRGIVNYPCSGVFAISRKLFDATGGYIEQLGADGAEDQCLMEQCRIFGEGIAHIEDHMTYHMWHPPGPGRYRHPPPNWRHNQKVWRTLKVMAKIGKPHDATRKYLATLGHVVPQ